MVEFSIRSVKGAPSGTLKLGRVTLLVGSEEKGAFKVGQALAAVYIANACNDVHIAFRKSFGVPASKVFEGGGELRLGGASFRIGPKGMELVREKLPWEHFYYFPALRTVALATLARIRRLPVHFKIVSASFVEAIPAPLRLFLEGLGNVDLCSYDYYYYPDEKVLEALGIEDDPVPTMGKIDLKLLDALTVNAKPNSLIVVEEPGIFKTVQDTINEVKRFLSVIEKKDLSIFMVASRLAPVYAVNEMVAKGVLKSDEVKAYYVKDSEIKEMDVVEGVGVSLDKVKFVADLAE